MSANPIEECIQYMGTHIATVKVVVGSINWGSAGLQAGSKGPLFRVGRRKVGGIWTDGA